MFDSAAVDAANCAITNAGTSDPVLVGLNTGPLTHLLFGEEMRRREAQLFEAMTRTLRGMMDSRLYPTTSLEDDFFRMTSMEQKKEAALMMAMDGVILSRNETGRANGEIKVAFPSGGQTAVDCGLYISPAPRDGGLRAVIGQDPSYPMPAGSECDYDHDILNEGRRFIQTQAKTLNRNYEAALAHKKDGKVVSYDVSRDKIGLFLEGRILKDGDDYWVAYAIQNSMHLFNDGLVSNGTLIPGGKTVKVARGTPPGNLLPTPDGKKLTNEPTEPNRQLRYWKIAKSHPVLTPAVLDSLGIDPRWPLKEVSDQSRPETPVGRMMDDEESFDDDDVMSISGELLMELDTDEELVSVYNGLAPRQKGEYTKTLSAKQQRRFNQARAGKDRKLNTEYVAGNRKALQSKENRDDDREIIALVEARDGVLSFLKERLGVDKLPPKATKDDRWRWTSNWNEANPDNPVTDVANSNNLYHAHRRWAQMLLILTATRFKDRPLTPDEVKAATFTRRKPGAKGEKNELPWLVWVDEEFEDVLNDKNSGLNFIAQEAQQEFLASLPGPSSAPASVRPAEQRYNHQQYKRWVLAGVCILYPIYAKWREKNLQWQPDTRYPSRKVDKGGQPQSSEDTSFVQARLMVSKSFLDKNNDLLAWIRLVWLQRFCKEVLPLTPEGQAILDAAKAEAIVLEELSGWTFTLQPEYRVRIGPAPVQWALDHKGLRKTGETQRQSLIKKYMTSQPFATGLYQEKPPPPPPGSTAEAHEQQIDGWLTEKPGGIQSWYDGYTAANWRQNILEVARAEQKTYQEVRERLFLHLRHRKNPDLRRKKQSAAASSSGAPGSASESDSEMVDT
jgi:hypothetical protein